MYSQQVDRTKIVIAEKKISRLEATYSHTQHESQEEKAHLSNELHIANKRISDLEILTEKLQDENSDLKKKNKANDARLPQLEQSLKKGHADGNKVISELNEAKSH